MSQTVQYVVDLKGAQEAQRELDRLNVAFDKNSSAALLLDKSISQMERDIKDLNAAIALGGPNVAQYRRALKDLQQSANQGAIGTRNLGQAALETSRGLEDLQYGIGGVVNNIPSLVMALGGTAGLTAVISLGAVAINQMVKNFTAVDPAAKDATEAAAKHVKGLRGEIADLAKDLRALEVGAARAAMEAQAGMVQTAAAAAEASLAPLGGLKVFERLKDRQDLPLTITENIAKATAAMAELDMEMAKLAGMRRIQIEKEEQKIIDLVVDQANMITENEIVAKKKAMEIAKEAAKTKYDVHVAGLEAEDKALKEVNDARRKDAKALARLEAKDMADEFADMDKAKAAAQKRTDKDREKQNEKTLKNIAKAEKKHAEEQAQYATQAVSIVAGASTQLVSDMISGQEHALERFGLSIMAQAGQALVSYGVQAIGRGVLEASNPITAALAPASFGAGAVLVAAGVGLGGVAGGVGSLMGGSGGGGDTRAQRDPGASPRRSSGTGDGGPIVLNLTYGAAGPLPEDTARLISRELRSGAKRAGR